jgi:hypothetical protein
LHDPEWRYFPTEEWKKQRREQRRRSSNMMTAQKPDWLSSRRPSLEFDDVEDDVEEITTGRRRRSEGDDAEDDEWDEKEYAFGGRKNRNRNRYRSFGYMDSTSSSSSYSPPQIRLHPPASPPSLPITLSPRSMLSRTSTIMSGESSESHPKRRLRTKLPNIFRKQSREQDEEKEDYYDYDVDDDVDVVPVNGLGLLGIDDSKSSTTASYDESSSTPLPPSYADASADTHIHPSSLDSLRSRAYKRYMALELSLTLGLVRTERKWRDWSGAKRTSLRTESF